MAAYVQTSADPAGAEGSGSGSGSGSVAVPASDAGPRVKFSLSSSVSHLATLAAATTSMQVFFRACGVLFYVFSREQEEESYSYCNKTKERAIADAVNHRPDVQDGIVLAEISGMAAVGTLYLRVSGVEDVPSSDMADYYYAIAKHLLDDAIVASPLRAMKVCVLLALYNIVLHATVALAYIGKSSHQQSSPVLTAWHRTRLESRPEQWRALRDTPFWGVCGGSH